MLEHFPSLEDPNYKHIQTTQHNTTHKHNNKQTNKLTTNNTTQHTNIITNRVKLVITTSEY